MTIVLYAIAIMSSFQQFSWHILCFSFRSSFSVSQLFFHCVYLLGLSNTDKQSQGKATVFFLPVFFPLSSYSLSLFLFGISHFLSSIQLGRLEILHPIGRVKGLCRSPSLAPQVAEGTWVVNGALCTVFLRGGPLSPALICHRSLSVHAPQCLIVSAKSPGSRPDLNNTFLPNSDPGFRFSSTHKGILSYCPRLRRELS